MFLGFFFIINILLFSADCLAMTHADKDIGLIAKLKHAFYKRTDPEYQEKHVISQESMLICKELKQKALAGISEHKLSEEACLTLHRYNERCYYAGERFIFFLLKGKPDEMEKMYKEIDHDELAPLIKLYIVGYLTHSTLMLEEKASKRTAVITGQTSPEAVITQTRAHQKRLLKQMAQDLRQETDNLIAGMMDNTAKLVDDRLGPASVPVNISRHDSDENETLVSKLALSTSNEEKEIHDIKNAIIAAAHTSIPKAVEKK